MNRPGTKIDKLPGALLKYYTSIIKRLPLLIIKLYLFLLLVGLALTGLRYTAFPGLTYCLNIFGEFCDAVENILISLISFPGFYFANSFFPNREDISPGNLFMIVIVFSIVFYFIIGLAIEKLKNIKKKGTKLTTEKAIIIIFTILLLLLILLLSQQS